MIALTHPFAIATNFVRLTRTPRESDASPSPLDEGT